MKKARRLVKSLRRSTHSGFINIIVVSGSKVRNEASSGSISGSVIIIYLSFHYFY